MHANNHLHGPTTDPANSSVRALCNAHLHEVVACFVPSTLLPHHIPPRRSDSGVDSRCPLTWKHPHDILMVLGSWRTSTRNQYAVVPRTDRQSYRARSCAQQLFADHSRFITSHRAMLLLEPPSHTYGSISFVLEEFDGKPTRRRFEFTTQSTSRRSSPLVPRIKTIPD